MRRLALCLVLLASGCGGGSAAVRSVAETPPVQTKSPRAAAFAYARCMRAHGVDHPDPDAYGDFHLTPARERALRAAAPPVRAAASSACTPLLPEEPPLSVAARAAALEPLRELKRCLAGFGVEVGAPIVKPMPHGRAMFGFDRATTPPTARGRAAQQRAQRTCERRVRLAARLDAIIAADRGENR